MKKSLVLLSAGLDSTVNLYEAARQTALEFILSFDYGQRAAEREIASAKKMARSFKIPHEVVELPFFKDWGQSSLVDTQIRLPVASEISIDDLKISQSTAKSVWVPNRNGVFLNIAAGFAEALKIDLIVPGFNLEEAATFPDNSTEFLEAMNRSLSYSTGTGVKTHCFTTHLSKTEIVKRGLELNVDFSMIWPCYQNLSDWCGECESCLRSKRAFQASGLDFLALRKQRKPS